METATKAPPLSWKGELFFSGVGVFLLMFQTTIQGWIDPWGFGPDLCLAVVIYTGLYTPLAASAALAVGLGFLKDATSGGVFGFYPGLFLIVSLAAGLARRKLDPAAPWYQVLIVFIFVLGAGGLTLAGLQFFGRPYNFLPSSWYSPAAALLISAVATALVGPLLFWMLDRVKPRTPADSGEES
ncbi:MAG: rod shape-determining protein MreD [Thermodesulfobacteriota bacterium]